MAKSTGNNRKPAAPKKAAVKKAPAKKAKKTTKPVISGKDEESVVEQVNIIQEETLIRDVERQDREAKETDNARLVGSLIGVVIVIIVALWLIF